MKPVLLMAVIAMSCVLAPRTPAQQGSPGVSHAPANSARVRDLEKLVKSQTQRIQRLEQDLQARDEEVRMLVKIVSRQSDKDSEDSDGGNTGSSDCDVNPAARILKAQKTFLQPPPPDRR